VPVLLIADDVVIDRIQQRLAAYREQAVKELLLVQHHRSRVERLRHIGAGQNDPIGAAFDDVLSDRTTAFAAARPSGVFGKVRRAMVYSPYVAVAV
jgi:hypothetical protein